MTAASAAAAIPVSYFFLGLGSDFFGVPNVSSTLRFKFSHSASSSSRDLEVIECFLSIRSTSTRNVYPRQIPKSTPMMFSIYIQTTLPNPMPLSSYAAISHAVVFISRFYPRGGKTYPTRAVNFLSSKHAGAAAVNPSRCFIFLGTWSGPIRLQLCCGLYYIFRA